MQSSFKKYKNKQEQQSKQWRNEICRKKMQPTYASSGRLGRHSERSVETLKASLTVHSSSVVLRRNTKMKCVSLQSYIIERRIKCLSHTLCIRTIFQRDIPLTWHLKQLYLTHKIDVLERYEKSAWMKNVCWPHKLVCTSCRVSVQYQMLHWGLHEDVNTRHGTFLHFPAPSSALTTTHIHTRESVWTWHAFHTWQLIHTPPPSYLPKVSKLAPLFSTSGS